MTRHARPVELTVELAPSGGPLRRLGSAGLAVDVLGQFATVPLARQALVCRYALLPETQAAAAAAVIARSLRGG